MAWFDPLKIQIKTRPDGWKKLLQQTSSRLSRLNVTEAERKSGPVVEA